MHISAHLNNIRIAPRKVRQLAFMLKGLDATAAQAQLYYIPKKSALPLRKLLDSALANAEHNFSLLRSNLFIKNIMVNEGPKLKRFRPKGFGSASPIEKKTSHVTVVLEERRPGLKHQQVDDSAQAMQQESRPSSEASNAKRNKPSQSPSTGSQQKTSKTGGLRGRLFRRKTG